MSGDRQQLEVWWREFAATGAVPEALEHVQSRLIRSVHRGELPGGQVYVKTMTFPRPKDRLRYLLRPLPAEHEAAALEKTRNAGLACPEVVEVRSRRRFRLPFRSWLVLRALPAGAEEAEPWGRLRDEAAVALRLLEAGIEHRDLHSDNFVRLQTGELAVLDMQSTSLHGVAVDDRARRIAAAARLVRERSELARRGAALREAGLLRGDDEVAQALEQAERLRLAYLRRRVLRCFAESTEFTRVLRWNGLEHRCRGRLPAGSWRWGGQELRRAWIGQRALRVFRGQPPAFPAFFRKWGWSGATCGLYVPEVLAGRVEEKLVEAAAGFDLYRKCIDATKVRDHGEPRNSGRATAGGE